MTKKTCILVWAIAIPFTISSNLILAVPITAKGWSDISNVSEVDLGVLKSSMAISTIFYNTPDFISIALYMKMSLHFTKRKMLVAPLQAVADGSQAEVWIGDVELGHMNNSRAAQNTPDTAQEEQHDVETRQIMAKLRLHILFSLWDLIWGLLNALLVRTLVGSIVGKIYFVVFCYWIPLLVIKENVKKLNGITSYLLSLAKCRISLSGS